MTQNMLDRDWTRLRQHTKLYFLDLIQYRDISNRIAERFNVKHQSPQILIIKSGQSIYDASHYNINVEDMLENL
jgi:bacillithiol system protein YtxJ